MKRNEAFDVVATLYDEIRPSYPEQLIKDLITKTKISAFSNLLEIGAGTGKATLQLAKTGSLINCIELGANMANILKSKCANYPNVRVDIASFEDWKPLENFQFDLIYSAQAFHWIDSKIKYQKCHRLLKQDGYLALFWYQQLEETTPVNEAINSLIRSYVPDFFQDNLEKDSYLETRESRRAEIANSACFEAPEILEYKLENMLDADSYIQSLNSFSKFVVLEERVKAKVNNEIERLIGENGGFINSKLAFSLYVARKSKTCE